MLEFQRKKPLIIGCVHVLPLPGAAGYSGNIDTIIKQACMDARTYLDAGFDALIIENMHDTPYLKGFVYPETLAAMTAVCYAIKQEFPDKPAGIQILSAANREALGAAIAAKLDFLRVECFTFAHVADEGILEATAAELIRIRNYLKADDITILADIKKKHSAHAITSDISIEEAAETAEFMRADGVIITGTATGKEPDLNELKRVKAVSALPVLLGSGITPDNVDKFAGITDGIIIGSYCKENGNWKNAVSAERCKMFLSKLAK